MSWIGNAVKGKKSSRGCGAMPDAAEAGGGEGEDGEEGGPQAAHQVGQHSLSCRSESSNISLVVLDKFLDGFCHLFL